MIDLSLFHISLFVGLLISIAFALRTRLGGRWLTMSAIALLLLAAVGVRVPGEGDPHQVFVVDLSFSTGGGSWRVASGVAHAMDAPERTTVIVFGEKALIAERSDNDWPVITEKTIAAVGRGASDLGGALRLAAEHVTDGGSITVFTDGRVEMSGLPPVVARLRSRGVRLRVVGSGNRVRGDRRMTSLTLPSAIGRGTGLIARAGVAGPEGSAFHVTLQVDGRQAVRRRVTLPPTGRSSLAFAIDPLPEGFHEISVEIESGQPDVAPENDRRSSGVVVTGARRALLINAWKVSLDGFEISSGLPDHDLSSYDLVVLRDLSIGKMPDGGEKLRQYVEDGGGLLVLGGPNSFGPGGWGGRPLEKCLPVRCHPEDEGLFVAILLDRSGTMGDPFTDGGPAKFASARRATLELLGHLPRGANVLLVPFNRTVIGEPVVVLLEDRAARESLRNALHAAGKPGGGTSLVVPLERVREGGASVRAEKRLVLLFTDGRAEAEDPAAIRSAAGELRRAGYRIECFAVGEDADRALLSSLTGDDRPAIPVNEGGRLEAEFLAALLRLEGEGRIRTGSFAAARTPTAGLDFNRSLALSAYVRTWPKDGAAVWHSLPDGSPVTASGRYGLGRTVAVMTDPMGPWAEDWSATGVMGALVTAAARPASLSGTRFALDGKTITAWVRTRAASLTGQVVSGPDRHPVRLFAAGDGSFRGPLPQLRPGAARVSLVTPDGPVRAGFSVPYASEYLESGKDDVALARLAGIFGPEPDDGRGPGRPAGPLLAGLALILFLCDRVLKLKREA